MKTLAITAALTGVIAALSTGAFAEDSIKVGVLVGYSGISSLSGQQTDAAIKLFQKRYGEAPGGKKIELIRRDTTGPNPHSSPPRRSADLPGHNAHLQPAAHSARRRV